MFFKSDSSCIGVQNSLVWSITRNTFFPNFKLGSIVLENHGVVCSQVNNFKAMVRSICCYRPVLVAWTGRAGLLQQWQWLFSLQLRQAHFKMILTDKPTIRTTGGKSNKKVPTQLASSTSTSTYYLLFVYQTMFFHVKFRHLLNYLWPFFRGL